MYVCIMYIERERELWMRFTLGLFNNALQATVSNGRVTANERERIRTGMVMAYFYVLSHSLTIGSKGNH